MDLKQLRRFISVADLGSFNKAAEVLSVSQPSLTRSIQLLEEFLDVQLFERGPRGIALTAVGHELLPHARVILNERDRAVATVDAIRGRRAAVISVGAEASFAMTVLPKAICAMSALHPDVYLSVREGMLSELLDAVREGRLSLALGSRAPYLDCRDLTFESLSTQSASVLIRSDHPLLRELDRGQTPDLALLARGRWIVSDNALIMEGWASIFTRSGLEVPQNLLRTSSLLVTKGCLLEGDFVSLGDVAAYENEIASGALLRLDLEMPAYSRPAGVFRRTGAKVARNERTFLQTLRHIFGAEASVSR